MRRPGILATTSLCLLGAALLSPRPARACSAAAPPAALKGIPANGDIDVPTDVRPVYDLIAAQLFDLDAQVPRFELTDASGQTIALAPQHGYVWNVELVPASELKPTTLYTLRGTWRPSASPAIETELSLSFTTGLGPLAAKPEPPVASMQHYALQGVTLSSCDPARVGTCLAIPSGSSVQLTYIDSFGQETASRAADGRLIGYLIGGPHLAEQGSNVECAKLRARGANGSLSEPIVLCGRDAPTFDLRGSTNIACTPAGLTYDGLLVSQGHSPNARLRINDTSGCSVAGGAPVVGAPAFIFLVGLVFVCRHRRRWHRATVLARAPRRDC